MKEKENLLCLLEKKLHFFDNLRFVANGAGVYIRRKPGRPVISRAILEELFEIADMYGLLVAINAKGLCVWYNTEEDDV